MTHASRKLGHGRFGLRTVRSPRSGIGGISGFSVVCGLVDGIDYIETFEFVFFAVIGNSLISKWPTSERYGEFSRQRLFTHFQDCGKRRRCSCGPWQ
jgi:hypothetical protein